MVALALLAAGCGAPVADVWRGPPPTRPEWQRREMVAALTGAERLVAARPNSAAAHVVLGKACLQAEQLLRAQEAFARAHELDGNAVEPLLGLAIVAAEGGDIRQALAALDAAEEQVGGHPDVRRVRGDVLRKAGDPRRAISLYELAAEARPDSADALVALSDTYLALGEYGQAADACRRALARAPGCGPAKVNYGAVLEAQGDVKGAEAAYREAIALDRTLAGAYNNLAYLYATQNADLEEALHLAETAAQLEPSEACYLDTLGHIQHLVGELDQAIVTLETAKVGGFNDPIIRYHLGLAYAEGGRRQAAVHELTRALELSTRFPGADDAVRLLRELQQAS